MPIGKTPIAQYVRWAADGQLVHWFPNPGNAGDCLISAVTEQLFRSHGIRYRVITDGVSFDSANKIVCYGGGGNLVKYRHRARDFLEQHHRRAARLIILPHTIEGNDDLLGEFSSHVTIICRDAVSYAHCRHAAPKAEVLAADDLVLSLTPPSLLGWRIIPSILAESKAYRSLRRNYIHFAEQLHGQRELSVWRGGVDQNALRTMPPTNDISQTFGLTVIGVKRQDRSRPHLMRLSAHFFLRAINRFDLVRTDRLHVGIAAAVLGKHVELYANAYFKNRAVFEFSLISLPNVRFLNWARVTPHGQRLAGC